MDSEEVREKRGDLRDLLKGANIIINPDTNWLWICPKCGSSEVCAYRWNVLENDFKLVEGDDNLEIKKG
jgi:hypothetical protein